MDVPASSAEPAIGKSGSDGISADKTPKMSTNPSFLSEEARGILRKSSMCSKLNDDQFAYFVEVVERTQLDPFLAQIRPDIRMSKTESGEKEPTLLIITTLAGLRTIGERSGQHDGESPIEWADETGQWSDIWLAKEPPVAARASVYRKDRSRPQTEVARWDAFVQLKWDREGAKIPNPFWTRMGSLMIGKCARAAAYRGAYPQRCSGLYISEELQDVLDPDSEEAIEAEMVRRARAEKEYWDKEREKGNLPIDEIQKLERERAVQQQQGPNGPLPAVGSVGRALVGAPILGSPTEVPVAPPLPLIQTPPPAPPPPQPTWQEFVITRIEALKGRSVGSLTTGEMQGLVPRLTRMQESWGALDADLKAHYLVLRERLIWDQAHPAEASLEFSVT